MVENLEKHFKLDEVTIIPKEVMDKLNKNVNEIMKPYLKESAKWHRQKSKSLRENDYVINYAA